MCCFALKWSLVCDQNNREKKEDQKIFFPRPKKIPRRLFFPIYPNRRIFLFCEEEGKKSQINYRDLCFLLVLVLGHKKTKKKEKIQHTTLNAQSRRLYQNCHHMHQKCFLGKKKKTAQKKTDCFCKEDKEEGDQNNCRGRRSRTTFTNSKKVRYNNNKQQQHHQRV